MVSKKEQKVAIEDKELVTICVPTKKIYLEVSETHQTSHGLEASSSHVSSQIEVVLRPFKQRHFASAIAIINKYFDKFNLVRHNYINQRKAILDRYEDQITRDRALEELDAGFNEGMEIAKAILSGGGEDIGEDIKTIIAMSISKATMVTSTENSTERAPIEPTLDDLTWGECLVLLGSTVGLNLDFFAQNSKAMNLAEVMASQEQRSAPKDGEKSLAT